MTVILILSAFFCNCIVRCWNRLPATPTDFSLTCLRKRLRRTEWNKFRIWKDWCYFNWGAGIKCGVQGRSAVLEKLFQDSMREHCCATHVTRWMTTRCQWSNRDIMIWTHDEGEVWDAVWVTGTHHCAVHVPAADRVSLTSSDYSHAWAQHGQLTW